MPIHDALHWSLAIVCHPGLLAQAAAAEAAAPPAAAAAGAAAIARSQGLAASRDSGAAGAGAATVDAAVIEKGPCIIHLDSMKGKCF